MFQPYILSKEVLGLIALYYSVKKYNWIQILSVQKLIHTLYSESKMDNEFSTRALLEPKYKRLQFLSIRVDGFDIW